MDARDFAILFERYRHPFASWERIGRAVGSSGTAVKTRWEDLVRREVVQGSYVLVPASAFRRWHRIASYFDVPSEPELTDLLAVENVVNVWRGAPRMVNVNTYDPRPESDPPPGLTELFGRPPDAYVNPGPPGRIPQHETVLSPLDWRVLLALVDDPHAPLRELATKAGLTERTVRRRRDGLLAKELLEVFPILDTSREPGSILYSGYAALRAGTKVGGIELRGVALAWPHHAPPAISFVGHADSYGEVKELELRIRSMPGVVDAIITVPRGGALATNRLRGWMRQEIARFVRPPANAPARRRED
jgi:DNA-binding Lrp family transcriptional regulator